MTTGGLVALILFFVVYKVIVSSTATQAKNYDYRKVSMGKMAMDHDKSQYYRNQKMINGGYDKDDKWRI